MQTPSRGDVTAAMNLAAQTAATADPLRVGKTDNPNALRGQEAEAMPEQFVIVEGKPGQELPHYRSHKLVRAAKIVGVSPGADVGRCILKLDNGITISVAYPWFQRHRPIEGGYLVCYADGYTSFSPAAAFESGYYSVTATELRVQSDTHPERNKTVTLVEPHPSEVVRDGAAKAEIPGNVYRGHQKPTPLQLANRFTHHPPEGDQVERYHHVRMAMLDAATACVSVSPCSPEQTRALNALDEAMFLFNAAIARNESWPSANSPTAT